MSANDTIDAVGLANDIGERFLSKIASSDDGRYSAERMAVALAEIKDCLTDAEESVSGDEDYQKWQVKKDKEGLEAYFSQNVWSAESHEGTTSEEVLLLNIEVLQRSTNKVKGALFKRMGTGGQLVFGQWFNYALYRLLQLTGENTPVGSMNDVTAIKMLKSLFTFIKDNLKGLKREKLRDQFGVSLVDSIKLARRVIDACTTKPPGLDEECSLVEIHVGLSTATPVSIPAADASLQEKQKDDDARQNRINAMRFRRASSKSFTISAADATISTSAPAVSSPVESSSRKPTIMMNPKPSEMTKPQSLAIATSKARQDTKPQSRETVTSKPRLEETSGQQSREKRRKVDESTTTVPTASTRQGTGEQTVEATSCSSRTQKLTPPPAKTHQTESFQMQQSQHDDTTRQETTQQQRGYAGDTPQAQPSQQRGYADVQAVTQQRGYADVPQIQQRGYTDARAEPRGYVDVPPVQQRGYADAPVPMPKYSDLPEHASGGADEFPADGRDRDRGYARNNSRDSSSQGRNSRNRRGGRSRNRGRAGEQQGESSRPKKRARRSAQEPVLAAVGAGARGRGRGRDVNKPGKHPHQICVFVSSSTPLTLDGNSQHG